MVADSSINIIDCILLKFVSIPLNMYDLSIVDHIHNFCIEWVKYCMENEHVQESQTIKNWNGGLRLLDRAMQSKRDESESHIPVATQEVRAVARMLLGHTSNDKTNS